MLNLLKILKGLRKKMLIHGPEEGELIQIDFAGASSVEAKAIIHLFNILYSKDKNYRMAAAEEILLYKDIVDSGITGKKINFKDLNEYKAYIFNNRHILKAA